MVTPISVAGRLIGPGHPCFVIAEVGVNHNGDMDLACKLIDAAVESGADAVKFQTFRADRLVTRDAPKAEYQKQHTDAAESQYEMLKQLELSEEDHQVLLTYCQSRGILFLSTPFDGDSARYLAELGVVAFKVSSGDLTDSPFLAGLARLGRPVMLSTGMAEMAEVAEAVRVIRENGNPSQAVLQCVSTYPAEPKDANLRAMMTMGNELQCITGYSDHTLGDEVALAAVALGASVLEKHLTLDTTMPGPDHAASMNPADFSKMVMRIRSVESCLGNGVKVPAASEKSTRMVVRKSIVMAASRRKGEHIGAEDFVFKRPGTGLPPSSLTAVVGRLFARDMAAGQIVTADCIE